MTTDIVTQDEDQLRCCTTQFIAEAEACSRARLKELLVNISASVRILNKNEFFSICDIDREKKMLSPEKPFWENQESEKDRYKNTSYKVLSALHCAYYNDFSREMKRLFPRVVIEALGFNDESLKAYLGDNHYDEVMVAINAPFPEDVKKPEKEKEKKKPLSLLFICVVSFFSAFGLSSLFFMLLFLSLNSNHTNDSRFISDDGIDSGLLIQRSDDEPIILRAAPKQEMDSVQPFEPAEIIRKKTPESQPPISDSERKQ